MSKKTLGKIMQAGIRLRQLLTERGISIAEFSEMCNLPLETVRNIYYGKTTDPKISTVMQMAEALNLSVNCFMGKCAHSVEEKALLRNFRMCGHHGKSLISLTAKYEAMVAKESRESAEKHKIPCLIPGGNVYDGIDYTSCETIEVEVAEKQAFVGIRLSTNDFIPFYCKGDTILLENRFPKNGEFGVFYRKGKIFIRKYIEEEKQYRLKCLHNMGEDIVVKRMDDIEYIGTCCSVIRED